MRYLVFFTTLLGLSLMGCGPEADYALVELSNPDDKAVAFGGSYESSLVDTSGLAQTTPHSFSIEVDPEGDHVTASFYKTTVNDTTNELRVELYYKGELKEAQVVKTPLFEWATVECDIP